MLDDTPREQTPHDENQQGTLDLGEAAEPLQEELPLASEEDNS